MRLLTGKELGRILEQHGWELARVHGSHHIYRQEGRPERISVPVHGSKPLKRGLQSSLLKIAGIDPESV
ncbi:type II toxin-antitoxin system HicA family toxin [Longimicrobium sp.]|uniref:type II toxin-antitoxin system HicA family toxin n=1 Tax=Longimicrobium sp. TaxID=2029185 RepID=UPI003B3AE75F